MRILAIGNYGVSHSTETHVTKSMELLGHEVVRCQENTVGWPERLRLAESCQLAWWCSTWDYAHRWNQAEAHAGIDKLNGMLPTVAQHLDKFAQLGRERMIFEEPWFRCRWVFTADGDSDDVFQRAGVNHHFLPPAVYGPECVPGRFRPSMASDVAFVGSWQGYGHPEHWPARKAMLDFLRATYGGRVRFWPERGKPAVRGQALNDLYASARVVVGDSCLAATSRAYVSDRLPESCGRGAALVFPYIEGAAEMFHPDEHVRYFMPGDLDALRVQVDWLLAHETERRAMIERAVTHARAAHTYERRVQTILDTVFR